MTAASEPDFSSVLGHERAKDFLGRFLKSSRIPSALLFHGPDGVGKKLLALQFAKALLCSQDRRPCGTCGDCRAIALGTQPDVKHVNLAYQASLYEDYAKSKTLRVKTIRHLRRDMELQSLLGSWKIAVIDDADSLEIESTNALLKIIEEPPPQTLWILVTARLNRIIATLRSRCFSIAFRPLPEATATEILKGHGLEPDRARLLARAGEGSISAAQVLEETLDATRQFFSDPMAASVAADSLPKELASQRIVVGRHLDVLALELRSGHLEGRLPFRLTEVPLRRLLELRRALERNADPKLVLTLAGETAAASRHP